MCDKHRPVSAYALFFRDTQAAIKQHNPSASFGEMSKIVASMWDSLDDIHKNVTNCLTNQLVLLIKPFFILASFIITYAHVGLANS